jgi:predicted dehydrogenase/threonine dehydrogenase-like Zn-dependent dehydrogenase
MKQVIQSLRTGQIQILEVPFPAVSRGKVLIRSNCSLISAGTERMLVEFGRSGWIQKARQQPDKVRQVIDKIRTDGLAATLEAVRSKLDQPLPLGYCNVGRVIALGEDVTGLSIGDRVASNGPHAEVVSVPANLCTRIPDDVTDEQAAFTVLGAIALEGLRLASPTLGECVAVIGLGLIGLITVQLLRANGCRVLGVDLDARRIELARSFGAQGVDISAGADPLAAAESFSRGRGVDAVIITAAAKSSEPVHQAARMCRQRGRIVLVGVTGLELSREDFYKKELTFQVSCSYGPGRYDPRYEEKGQDYPVGFVRWTAQRNFEAVLDMMAQGKLDVNSLISHSFPLAEAHKAYELLTGDEPSLGILLAYPKAEPDALGPPARSVGLPRASGGTTGQAPRVNFVGAGSHAGRILIPAFREAGAVLNAIGSAGGMSAAHLGRKFGFARASSDAESLLQDPDAHAVVISTRHDTHACLVLEALQAGKHVFVEKPLCMSLQELQAIEEAYTALAEKGRAPVLLVGFNRRFSPLAARMREMVTSVPGPLAMVATVNAGAVPPEHWVQDPVAGGGRILGEACHFVDLLRFLAGAPLVRADGFQMESPTRDTASLQLVFSNGSIATVHYFANGSRSFPKERVEIFANGRVLQLDNFRVLRGFGWPGFRGMRLWRQDKGHRACVQAFLESLRRGEPSPIPWEEILEVSRVVLGLACGGEGPTPERPS